MKWRWMKGRLPWYCSNLELIGWDNGQGLLWEKWSLVLFVTTINTITLEAFDFSFQPSVDAKKLRELATCSFVNLAENVVFLGPPRTGKTHLSIVLGLKTFVRHRFDCFSYKSLCGQVFLKKSND
jgi:hypothetical protein